MHEKEIKKKFGDVVLSGDFLVEEDRYVYSLGPKLDYALGGGVPEGCFVVMAANEGQGKTTLALYLAHQVLERGKKAFFLDVEHRLRRKNMNSIAGFDPSKLKFIRSTKDKILESEDFLEILLSIVSDPANEGGIAIVDSVDALIPESVREAGNVSGSRRAPNSRAAADAIRQVTPHICVNNFLVVFIAHLYDNVSGYGGPVIGGGRYQRYQGGVVMKSSRKPKELMDGDKQVGHVVEWDILKSELGPIPGMPIENYLRFGHGVDEITELLHMAADVGLITKSGSWYELDFLEDPVKVQGGGQFFTRMEEHPEEFKILKDAYKKAICM